jgi:hypothetical protein
VLALTSVSATGAERYRPNETIIVPPAEFDKPFVGQLEEFIINDLEELTNFCEGLLGCAKRLQTVSGGPALFCSIYLPADELIRRYGLTIEIVRRHEIAHCNGWDHPPASDLPKIDPWSLKVGKPE